jgi:chemotaxis protein CheX
LNPRAPEAMMMDRKRIVDIMSGAVHEVFRTMLNLPLQRGEDYLERGPPEPQEGVVSLIGLAGKCAGTGSICCSSGFACKISARMLICEYTDVGDEVLDAVAEVTNMIMGNVKTALEESLGPMGLSIPTVVYGRKFTTRGTRSEEWIVVPFDCDGEKMSVKLCLAGCREVAVRRNAPRPASIAC